MKLNNFYKLLILLFLFSCNFAPGSYPHAEKYEVEESETELINAIKKFKEINFQYKVPENIKLTDGRSNSTEDHWYHIYFFYPEKRQIIYTWTRPSGKNKSNFALISISHLNELGNWQTINKDFSKHENEKVKREFEERILSKVKSYL